MQAAPSTGRWRASLERWERLDRKWAGLLFSIDKFWSGGTFQKATRQPVPIEPAFPRTKVPPPRSDLLQVASLSLEARKHKNAVGM